MGLTATCNAGGVGGGWKDEYTASVKGASTVIIIADKDEPGRKHAGKVCDAIRGAVGSVRVIEMPGDGVKDASDWVAAGGTRLQLESLAQVRDPGSDDVVKPSPAEEAFDRHAPTVGSAVDPALALFARRFSGEETPIPLPWSETSVAMGGGLWPGAHVITGATGAGKTALAMQIVLHACRNGHPTLYIGLELDTAQIVARLASLVLGECMDGRVAAHWSSIYLGKVNPDQIASALVSLQDLPLHVEEGPPGGWSVASLRGRVEVLKARHPGKTPLVVLDFLQLVGPTDPKGRREELRERIGAASYMGREVARKCGAVVVMLSSISRAGSQELTRLASDGALGSGDPMDLVGLGKESGDIEFSADSVLCLAKEPRIPGASETLVWLALAKMRAGPPAWSLLRFNGSWLSEVSKNVKESWAQERKSSRDEEKQKRKTESFVGHHGQGVKVG
jgi:hypothetical protein